MRLQSCLGLTDLHLFKHRAEHMSFQLLSLDRFLIFTLCESSVRVPCSLYRYFKMLLLLCVCVKAHPNKKYFAVAEKGNHPNIIVYEYPSLRPFRILRGKQDQDPTESLFFFPKCYITDAPAPLPHPLTPSPQAVRAARTAL